MKVAICKFSFVLDLSRLLLVLNKWIMKNGTSEENKKTATEWEGKKVENGCETEMRKLCANTLTKQQPFRLVWQARKKGVKKKSANSTVHQRVGPSEKGRKLARAPNGKRRTTEDGREKLLDSGSWKQIIPISATRILVCSFFWLHFIRTIQNTMWHMIYKDSGNTQTDSQRRGDECAWKKWEKWEGKKTHRERERETWLPWTGDKRHSGYERWCRTKRAQS